MHNNIMAAGSKDRPPMLGPGRYSQWRSRFLRYLDTKSNGEYLRKCIFEGPYTPTSVLIAAVEAAENILPVAAHEEAETIHNMTTENKLYFQAEKEAIFLILTGIGDEIYSTVDACNTAKEMWTAIERLQQGESLNVQDVKTNLFWEFGKFTSRDGESMESYYSRFYKLMNELTRNNLQVSPMQVNVQFLQQLQPEWSRFVTVVKQREEIDTVSYHRLFDVLKQFQNEVNDIRSERLARSANPLALLAAAQPYSDNYYQAPKPQRSNAPSYMQSSSTRPSATTRHKGKEIAKPVTPQSESVSEEDSDPEQARRDKDMQKNLALLAKYFKKLYKPTNNNLRTSSNSRNKTEDTTPRYNNDNQSGQFGNQRTMTVAGARETVGSPVVQQNGIQCFNCKGFGHYARECRKPKRVKDYAYHKEKMMMCKQAEQGVPLQAEQADWLEDTDEEIDEQKKDTLSLCSDSEIQQMQLIQDKTKESCMVSFQRLHSHLKCLLNNDLKGSRTEGGFKRAFTTLFCQDLETFTGTMFLNMDQLQKQLDNNEFQEIGSMASFKVLETQFQMFIKSKIYLNDEYIVMTRNYFLEYTRLDIPDFRDTLIRNMDYVKKSIEKRALHKMEYDSRVNERLMQTTEEKVDLSKALDASLVIIESNGTESQHDTSSRSGNDAHVDDADIRPIYNEEPMAEVQTTAEINIFATGQQHTEQPEFNNEGKVDQNAEQCHDICPLPAKLTDDKTIELSDQSLESENVCLKKIVAQFQKYFGKLEAHCINLELQMQNNVLKSGQQSQFLKEKGNEAKVKNDIDVIETINIELEHSVAKLLAENEQLHKENEYLKQTYKDLFDSIKRT
ncbi:retrovirus-related pol polyprotein from transposon TNT 1-94 [Tanacetum coccineum]